jgi:hypothetical protein
MVLDRSRILRQAQDEANPIVLMFNFLTLSLSKGEP